MSQHPSENETEEEANKKNEKKAEDEKWIFEDYAYTITGIIVGLLLVGPQLLYSIFGINILGGDISDIGPALADGPEYGIVRDGWSFNELRALSPLLFILTTTIVFFKEAADAKKTGGYTGSLFNHTFESLFEEAIYMAITTVMLYAAVLFGMMYISWLAGPITWILFIFLFPIVRRKRNKSKDTEDANDTNDTTVVKKPWFLLLIFAAGLIGEGITQAWVVFPLTWLIICAVTLFETIREPDYFFDKVFNVSYYAFSVVLMAVGVAFRFWIMSWAPLIIALILCWILSKFKRFKKYKYPKKNQ